MGIHEIILSDGSRIEVSQRWKFQAGLGTGSGGHLPRTHEAAPVTSPGAASHTEKDQLLTDAFFLLQTS